MKEDELINKLRNLTKKFNSASEFIKDPEVRELIYYLDEEFDSKTLYFIIIEIMI